MGVKYVSVPNRKTRRTERRGFADVAFIKCLRLGASELLDHACGPLVVLKIQKNQVTAALHTVFGQQIGDMKLNCTLGDSQVISDLFVRTDFPLTCQESLSLAC